MIISSESALTRHWDTLRASDRRALIPYLTAGHPTLDASREALRMAAEFADIIEVGVPFSDPLADGPTIQASTFRALANGMTLAGTLDLIAQCELPVPVVLFTYLNPVMQYGVERLLADASVAGIAGLLLTDLPGGGDPAIEGLVHDSSLDLIRLLAPNMHDERLRETLAGAGGFVYLIARLGVTGASAQLDRGLEESIARVRAQTPLPIAVGFGVSTPAQAAHVAQHADGVVVGSALVDRLTQQGVAGAARFLAELRAAIDANR